MSGLALTAFVVSLVLALVALMGLWVAMAVPLVLGFVAWTSTQPERFRGRAFALWAMGISLACGACSYLMHDQFAGKVRTIGAGVLGALQGGDPQRLDDWLTSDARREPGPARLRERFAAVVAEVGPYTGPVEAGGVFTGIMSTLVPPSGLTEIAPPPTKSQPMAGEALWVRARFERATLDVEIVVGGGGQGGLQKAMQDMAREGAMPVVTDLRFFRSGAGPTEKRDG